MCNLQIICRKKDVLAILWVPFQTTETRIIFLVEQLSYIQIRIIFFAKNIIREFFAHGHLVACKVSSPDIRSDTTHSWYSVEYRKSPMLERVDLVRDAAKKFFFLLARPLRGGRVVGKALLAGPPKKITFFAASLSYYLSNKETTMLVSVTLRYIYRASRPRLIKYFLP